MKCNYKKTIVSFLMLLTLLSSCKKTIKDELIKDESIKNRADQVINIYMNRSHSSECDCKLFLASDAIVYPNPWTEEIARSFSISNTRLKNMSTCGLIQSYINQPWNILGPWCCTCSNYTSNGMDYFNDKIANNLITTELFSRTDMIEKLLIRYICYIQNLESIVDKPGTLHSFELLLASKAFNDVLSKTISEQLLILATKMIDVKKAHLKFNEPHSLAITRHIMLNILLKSNTNLISKESLKVGMLGYEICYENNKVETLSEKYLNELKN